MALLGRWLEAAPDPAHCPHDDVDEEPYERDRDKRKKPDGWQKMLDNHRDKITVGARFHQTERTVGTVTKSTVGMVETFAGASSQPEYEQWHERAKGFLPLKEAGFYVDIDDGNLTSDPPVDVGKDMAVECLTYARSEVQRLYAAEIVRNSLPPLNNPSVS